MILRNPVKKSLLLLLLLLTTTEALLANVEVFLIALPQENRKDLNGFDTCTFLRKAIDVIHSMLLTLHA